MLVTDAGKVCITTQNGLMEVPNYKRSSGLPTYEQYLNIKELAETFKNFKLNQIVQKDILVKKL